MTTKKIYGYEFGIGNLIVKTLQDNRGIAEAGLFCFQNRYQPFFVIKSNLKGQINLPEQLKFGTLADVLQNENTMESAC